jgi:hypothetical protein
MGDLVILDDVRSGPLKSRDELLLEWRLLGEQLGPSCEGPAAHAMDAGHPADVRKRFVTTAAPEQ